MSGQNEPLKFSIERLLSDDGYADRNCCTCQYCLLSLCYQFHNNYRIEKSVQNDGKSKLDPKIFFPGITKKKNGIQNC